MISKTKIFNFTFFRYFEDMGVYTVLITFADYAYIILLFVHEIIIVHIIIIMYNFITITT